MALVFMLITDVPLLFVQLVPDAHAILGVRRRTARRTAVVVGSAASAEVAASQQQTAAAQQEAAAAEKEAAAAKQEAAAAQQQAAQSASAVPIGTVVPAIPAGCTTVVANNANYFNCAGVFYKAAFQGNNLVYAVVPKP
jgi:hypothetical protein